MTKSALYVATPKDHYTDSGYSSDTRIDRFAAVGPKVSWKATGLVSGTLINQFAMDENDGYCGWPPTRTARNGPTALQRLRQRGLLLALVTNQSGVAKGLISDEQLAAVNVRVETMLGGVDLFRQRRFIGLLALARY